MLPGVSPLFFPQFTMYSLALGKKLIIIIFPWLMGRCMVCCVNTTRIWKHFHIRKSPCSSTGPDSKSLGLAKPFFFSETKRALPPWPRMEPSLSTGPALLRMPLPDCCLFSLQAENANRCLPRFRLRAFICNILAASAPQHLTPGLLYRKAFSKKDLLSSK